MNSTNSNNTQSSLAYLAFQIVIRKVHYPAALFRFDGNDAYCWSWLDNGRGYLSYADLSSGVSENFGKTRECHTTYHESGVRQLTVSSRKQRRHLIRGHHTPISLIQQWKGLTSVPIPLTAPLPWMMDISHWKQVR